MRVKFDLSGAVEKMTIFKELEGKANLDCHVEIEFGADELGMIYEFQKHMIPEVLQFIKEMKRDEETNLEKNELENKIESLEIQLDGERGRHEVTKKNRDEYFNKYIKMLDNENKRIQRETEEIRKRSQDSRKTQKQEEDDDELY